MEKRLSVKAAVVAIAVIVLFVFFNPLSLFIEAVLISRYDPAFLWHLYEFMKEHALAASVILFWIIVTFLILKTKESIDR